MTQEDKKLLLLDLCARLPHSVICYNGDTESNFMLCDVADIDSGYPTFDYGYGQLEDIRPYLRPVDDMTEEEKHELLRFGVVNLDKYNNAIDVCCVGFGNHAKVQDYLNSIHVDYRGLIEKGLAIEVTEDNNPYINK